MRVRKYISPFPKQVECAAVMQPSFRLIGGDVIKLAGMVNEREGSFRQLWCDLLNTHQDKH